MPEKVCFIWDQALCKCPRARCMHRCERHPERQCDCVNQEGCTDE